MRIICFSSLFPHAADPTLGVFVFRRLNHLLADTDITAKVIAPVPWFPFTSLAFGAYGRAARAPLEENIGGVQVYHPRFFMIPKIGMRLTPGALMRAALPVFRRIIAEGYKPDLIDAHYLYPDGVAAARLSQMLDIPFVMTARGSDVTQIPAYGFARKAIVAASMQAAKVITVSQSLADELQQLGVPANQLQTVRNGVDLREFHPNKKHDGLKLLENLGVPDWQGARLLVAGWLIPRKRVDRVIEAVRKYPDVQLLIAGDGPLRSTLEQQVGRLDLSQRCYFLGQQSPKHMPQLMAAADLLVLASEREGWANVLLEAMASGTPVLATDVGGAREFVKSPAGMLFGINECLSDKLGEALNALARTNLQAVRSYAENFSWVEVSRQQEAIFCAATDQKYISDQS